MDRRRRYPDEVDAFIMEHSEEYSLAEMAAELKTRFNFEKSQSSLKALYSNRHLHTKPRKGRMMPQSSKFPVEMHAYIRQITPGRSYKEITALINEKFGDETISEKSVKTYLRNHKLSTGRTGHFEKGHIPWSKGKKIEEIIKDPEKRKNYYASQFKPGHKPINLLPVGSIVKNREGYLLRKKQMEGSQWERWEMLHRAVWEEHNGKIPEGMIVTFKDGNREHCSIDNLALATQAENVLMTNKGFRSEDPDLTMAGLTVIRIDQQLAALQKTKKGQKKTNC